MSAAALVCQSDRQAWNDAALTGGHDVGQDPHNGSMEPRDRILGPIQLPRTGDSETVQVDFGDLIRKLVLAEQVLLETGAVEEFPPLIAKFGYDGVSELLRSGRLRVISDWVTAVQTGQVSVLEWRVKKGLLPLGSYSLGIVRPHDVKQNVHTGLQAINELPGLRGKQAQRLRQLIGHRIVAPKPERGQRGVQEAKSDLENNPTLLRNAIVIGARRHFAMDVDAGSLGVHIESLDDSDFRVETNLGQLLGVDEETTHKVVERGVLGIAGLHIRLSDMEQYQAVTGFQDAEVPLMEEKLGFLARQLDLDVQVERFERVVELLGLPDVSPDPDVKDVDLARLIEVVDGDEAREFRQWLRGIDTLDDTEVRDQIRRIREALAHAIHSPSGKAVRLLTATGVGVPLPPVGVALSALDMFVTDKILRENGPTAFLGRLYPSVFRS
jgi:hypothetical protein